MQRILLTFILTNIHCSFLNIDIPPEPCLTRNMDNPDLHLDLNAVNLPELRDQLCSIEVQNENHQANAGYLETLLKVSDNLQDMHQFESNKHTVAVLFQAFNILTHQRNDPSFAKIIDALQNPKRQTDQKILRLQIF